MTDSATEKAVNNNALVVIAIFSRGQELLAGHPGQTASNSDNRCIAMQWGSMGLVVSDTERTLSLAENMPCRNA